MVGLVDEQVAKDGGHCLAVVDAVVTVNRDDAAELRRAHLVTEGNQPPVGLELGCAECCCRIGQLGPADGSATRPSQVGEVPTVDEKDVLQRLA